MVILPGDDPGPVGGSVGGARGGDPMPAELVGEVRVTTACPVSRHPKPPEATNAVRNQAAGLATWSI